MLGMVLLYVGAVLFLNGLSMLGRIDPREVAIMNIFTGGVAVAAAAYNAFVIATPSGIEAATYGLLFAFTYLWVAYNNLSGADGRGLGWFSLFVAITVIPVGLSSLPTAVSVTDYWLTMDWFAWSVLWLGFFLLGALGKTHLKRKVAWLALVQGILTAWLPGYLLVSGHMPG